MPETHRLLYVNYTLKKWKIKNKEYTLIEKKRIYLAGNGMLENVRNRGKLHSSENIKEWMEL